MKIRANAWSRLGQNATFGGIGMIEVMKEHEDVQFITADVSTLLGLGKFKTNYPEHYFDVGIAEQNMVTVAAGMASSNQCKISWYVLWMCYRKKRYLTLVYRRYGIYESDSEYDSIVSG